MNVDHSGTYFQRIWQKIKRVLSEPRSKRKCGYYVSNEGDSDCFQLPCKLPRLELVGKSMNDTFDQSAFLEVMKKLLTCSVCLEVRKQANQCQNGHLICMNCTLCLQQSSTSKEINCPVCRVPLADCYQRSLLAEQLVSELPTKCRLCACTMSVKQLAQHEAEVCLSRVMHCPYELFGCNWKGLAKQKRHHEMICSVGLSSIASASDVLHSNFKKQLNYYEKKNSQWNSTITKLRERNKGLKMLMKHVVLSKNKHDPNVKSSFKTSKLEIMNHQFLLKFNITKNKKSPFNTMYYKLKYLNKQKLSMNFFLYSIRYDDDLFELDDNLHYHTFTEEENNAGSYNICFSKNQHTDFDHLYDTFSVKDSLYLEIVIILDSSDICDFNSINSQQEGSDSIAQAISANRNGLAGSNAGNLVVALISSNSLASQANEEASEEQYDQDDDAGEQEDPEEDAEEDHDGDEQDQADEQDTVDPEEEQAEEEPEEEQNAENEEDQNMDDANAEDDVEEDAVEDDDASELGVEEQDTEDQNAE